MGRSAKDAIQKVDKLLYEGYTDIVDADLSKHFDTIPHTELMQCVAEERWRGHGSEVSGSQLYDCRRTKAADRPKRWTGSRNECGN
jgi:RNA-directed DNA polymerase